MAFISWDESLSTGIEHIDEEHQKLIELINILHDAMWTGTTKDIIPSIFFDLINYTIYHFQNEEKYMEKIGFNGLENHKLIHEALINQVKKLREDMENNSLTLNIDLSNFLKDWIVNHIQKEDMQYTDKQT